MTTARDYYEILGLQRTATRDEIKRRYRELALEHHPDRNPDPAAAERFKEVSEAYAVLSDDEKRSAYDRYGHAGVDQRWREEDIFRGVDFEEILRGFGGRTFEDLFSGLFGGGFGRARRGRDIHARLSLTLEEVASGVRRKVTLDRNVPCNDCRGDGAAPGGRTACRGCGGSGRRQHVRGGGGFRMVQVTPCADCRGAGSVVTRPCGACAGAGAVRARSQLEIRVPAGIEVGQVLRAAGQGEAGPGATAAGDLLIEIAVEPHARFERRGPDLIGVLPVPYATAALGGEVEAELLGGAVDRVKVPAGTQGGTVLTLKGRGLRDERGRTGDLLWVVQIAVPERITPRLETLLREIEAEAGDARAVPTLNDRLRRLLRRSVGADADDDDG